MSVQSMCSGDAQLVPGEVRGYRMWRARGAYLTATNAFNGEWARPQLTATCRRRNDLTLPPEHDAPHERCGCGIYGWYRPNDTRLHRGHVFGVIAASGRVLLGDYGFRAERARIVALVLPEIDDAAADPVSRLAFYRRWEALGVRVFGSRERLLAEFPPEDVRELLGHEIPDTPAWPPAGSLLAAQAQMNAAARALGVTMRDAMEAHRKAIEAFRDTLRADLDRLVERIHASGGHVDVKALLQIVGNPTQAPRHPVFGEEAKRRALELRRQGTRGPEKPRRGRRRLSL